MRFRLWEVITFAALLVLAIVFGMFKSVWHGFSYFSASFVFGILILLIINRIFYIKDIKLEFIEREDLYFAELLNNGYITRAQFDERDPKILKGYYRDFFRARRLQIIFIIVAFVAIVASIVAIIRL
ncbi:MAG: hypothetical protein J5779_03415 [Clostridia bacterium]|nr:hypothetical protein [Clostridia bacterium]